MKRLHLIAIITLLNGTCILSTNALAQADCATLDYLEELNKSVIDKRVAHLKGVDAKIFILLDPYWSRPEFDDVEYRHPEDMKNIKKQLGELNKAEIDELVIWKFRRPALLAGAIPFSKGCAVNLYGEPDYLDKLMLMHDATISIKKHGIDSPEAKSSVEKLVKNEYPQYPPHDRKAEIILQKIRPFMPAD